LSGYPTPAPTGAEPSERAFRGVFINADLWLSRGQFTLAEKALLVEIDSLSRRGYCWASNTHFAELIGTTPRTVQRILAGLVDRKGPDGQPLYPRVKAEHRLDPSVLGGHLRMLTVEWAPAASAPAETIEIEEPPDPRGEPRPVPSAPPRQARREGHDAGVVTRMAPTSPKSPHGESHGEKQQQQQQEYASTSPPGSLPRAAAAGERKEPPTPDLDPPTEEASALLLPFFAPVLAGRLAAGRSADEIRALIAHARKKKDLTGYLRWHLETRQPTPPEAAFGVRSRAAAEADRAYYRQLRAPVTDWTPEQRAELARIKAELRKPLALTRSNHGL
jgi:hypothetical protein